MTLQQNTDRIMTTHVGSLPRPHDLLDMMKARLAGQDHNEDAYHDRVRTAVAECVRKQAEAGIDILCDGEQSKSGFFTYVRERLDGFEARPQQRREMFVAEIAAFPEYYEQYFRTAMLGGAVAPVVPLVCTGPIRYRGAAALRRDIDNLKAALASVPHHAAFMPAVAPSGVGANEYYNTDEAFFLAVGEALHTEYQAIVDAGFILQIDDPFLSDLYGDPAFDAAQRHTRAEIYVAAINASLRGIPAERVRYHTCYGINHGPRIHEAALADVAGHMLRVNAGAYSFEAANARHEHEYHLWETVKLPAGQGADPGGDHAFLQHRRAPRVDRRTAGAVRAAGGAGECRGRGGLRILVAGHVSDRGASDGDLGEVRGAAGWGGDREPGAVGVRRVPFPLSPRGRAPGCCGAIRSLSTSPAADRSRTSKLTPDQLAKPSVHLSGLLGQGPRA